MSYTLQAVVSSMSVRDIAAILGLEQVQLQCGLYLIPIPYKYVNEHGLPFLPLTDEGTEHIGDELLGICLKLSERGKIAYVEAEFFGGQGTQGCSLLEYGTVVEAPKESKSAINYALKWLGVLSTESKDEFEIAGLGMQRSTEDWLRKNA
jgi:hypothetical protein